MASISKEELLRIPQAVEEIKRHLWIESEQAGYDIGFDNAADDWIKKYSIEWLKYYMPEKVESPKKAAEPSPKPEVSKPEAAKKETIKKEIPSSPAPKKAVKRSAKSYKSR